MLAPHIAEAPKTGPETRTCRNRLTIIDQFEPVYLRIDDF